MKPYPLLGKKAKEGEWMHFTSTFDDGINSYRTPVGTGVEQRFNAPGRTAF